MAHMALIHGFATGLTLSVFRDRRGADAGFSAFRPLIERGEASAFRWDLQEDWNLLQSINPFSYLRAYRKEQAKARAHSTQEALQTFLLQEQPQTIVCHSMGCDLLLHFIEQYGLPETVRNIIFVQADIPTRPEITHPSVHDRLATGHLRWQNVYCPWDPSLIISTLLHLKPRAGLYGLTHPHVANQFFPLTKSFNLHMSSIRDPRFIQTIVETSVLHQV